MPAAPHLSGQQTMGTGTWIDGNCLVHPLDSGPLLRLRCLEAEEDRSPRRMDSWVNETDGVFVVFEWTAYVVTVDPVLPGLRVYYGDKEAQPLSNGGYLIIYENYLGSSHIRVTRDDEVLDPPLVVEVVSPKLSLDETDPLFYPEFYRRLVEGVASLLPHLVYNFVAPTDLPAGVTTSTATTFFHYHFFREHASLLRAALAAVGHDPHRVLVREEVVLPAAHIRRLDASAVRWLAASPEVWVESCRERPAAWAVSSLTSRMPERVLQHLAWETYDTPENRFVSHFADMLLRALSAILESQMITPPPHVAKELALLRRELQIFLSAPWLSEVGLLAFVPAGSHVLQRRSGYRELYHLYPLFIFGRSPLAQRLGEALASRDVAKLYELWSLFNLVRACEDWFGPVRPLDRDDAQDAPRVFQFANGARLWYQRIHAAGSESYSVRLVPDFTIVRPDGGTVSLDAKFRLSQEDLVEARNSGSGASPMRAAVLEDLFKMHAYRDALGHRASVVLYPGDRAVFFRKDDGSQVSCTLEQVLLDPRMTGIGALPWRP